MRQQSVHQGFPTTFVLLGFACATGMAGCAWDEFKEGGYGVMQEHQTQRCLKDPSRQSSDCVNHQFIQFL